MADGHAATGSRDGPNGAPELLAIELDPAAIDAYVAWPDARSAGRDLPDGGHGSAYQF